MRSEDAASISSRQHIPNMEKFVILVSLLSVFLPAAYSWPYDYYTKAHLEQELIIEPPELQQCPRRETEAQRECKKEFSEFKRDLQSLLERVKNSACNKDISCPNLPTSCAEVLKRNPSAESGTYVIQKPDCTTVQVICIMELDCDGVIGGWMQVINVDKRKGDGCPPGTTTLSVDGKELCGNGNNDDGSPGCSSTNMNVNGIPYGQICGKIHAYQYGSTDAFGYYDKGNERRNASTTIDGAYVDGISLTYDKPRKHIWTFAGGLDEYGHIHTEFKCACTDKAVTNGAISAPSFVGDDYFCETAVRNTHWDLEFHPEDPLWDGKGCENFDYCCEQKKRTTTSPWFRKQLSEITTADIEMRMCRDDKLFIPEKNDPYHKDPSHKDNNGHPVENTDSINFDEDTPFDQLAIYVR